MKLNFSNLLAIASILVWATAWAATETKTSAGMQNAPASNADYVQITTGQLQASR